MVSLDFELLPLVPVRKIVIRDTIIRDNLSYSLSS